MKKLVVITLLAIFISTGCEPSQTKIQEAIQLTQTAQPTNTVIPPTPTENISTETPIPLPTITETPTFSPGEIQDIFIEGIETLISIMAEDDISNINLIRLNNNVLEVEVKTKWASRGNQPDVSYKIVQLVSMFAETWEDQNNKFLVILPNGFDLKLTTYSEDGDYKYGSYTTFDTLAKINAKSISYEEWLIAANADFK